MKFPIKGSLAEVSFIEILKDASHSELTGMIRSENGQIIKVVYFQRGSISFASSNERTDRLTEVLRRAGKLTPEQVQDAQARIKPNVSLGKTLVELGYISAKDLLWGARAQVDGILHHLLFWNQGKYQILEGPLPKEIIHLNLSVSSVIFDGIMGTQNREWILQHIGSPDAIYAVSTDFEEQNRTLKLPVQHFVSKLNGRRSLHEIAEMSDQDSFEICKTVVALECLDLARPIQDEPLQMELSTPVESRANQIEESIDAQPEMVESQKLGQVLQIPTVAELAKPSQDADQASEKIKEPAAEEPWPKAAVEAKQHLAQAPEEHPSPLVTEPPAGIEHMKSEPESVEETSTASVPAQSLAEEESAPAEETEGGIKWKSLLTVVLALIAAGLAVLYYFQIRTPPASSEQKTYAPEPTPVSPETQPVDDETTSNPAESTEEESTAAEQDLPEDSPIRLLASGNVTEAAEEWKTKLTGANGYSIQLVIACQEKTVQDTYRLLNNSKEMIVLPMLYRGNNCFRVLYGQYESRKSAEEAIQSLPTVFTEQASPASVISLRRTLAS